MATVTVCLVVKGLARSRRWRVVLVLVVFLLLLVAFGVWFEITFDDRHDYYY